MITTVLSWGSMLLNLAKLLKPEDSTLDETKKVLDSALKATSVMSTNSVARSAQRSIISPMVVVEKNLVHQEYMPDLMTIIQLRDILNTLTHLAMQGEVGGIRIASLIDGINPKRSGMMALSGMEQLGGLHLLPAGVAGLEANDTKPDEDRNTVTINGKEVSSLSEFTPLALGRVVTAETNINGVKVNFPLVFRQTPIAAPTSDLELVFQAAKPEDGFRARIGMAFSTEEITPAEFFTGSDIIREKFRIRSKEVAGYYSEAQARAKKNMMETVRTGTISMNTMANAFVMSAETARQIELEIGMRFANASARDKIFKRVVANTIVVCDENRGVYTFYTDGASMPEQFTRSEIKTKAGKDSSSNSLQDLMKLLNGGM